MTDLILAPSTRLAELEEIIERGMSTFFEVGSALKEIIDGKLWEPNYNDFEDFCYRRFGFHKRTGYSLVTASNVFRDVSEKVQISAFELKFSQALAMVKLNTEQRVVVGKQVKEGNLTVDQVQTIVNQTIAAEKRKPIKIPSRPPRGTAIIRSLSDLRSECADLLILSTPSDPPILTEIGQYLRPGCSFLVPFQVPMLLMTSDPSVHMLGILGVQRSERGDNGPLIIEQDLFGWFSRGDYVGGRCSNRLERLSDVIGAMTWPGDTIVEMNATSRSVLDATVPCDRHYIAVNPSASVADAISEFTN